ncbi:MAG: hypothetical protein RLZZ574_2038 [Cyanobacteriota bacterium]|jgi:NADPH2:quinone reductase
MKWLLVLAAVVAGGLLPTQAGINTQLARNLGHPLLAASVSFVVGAIALSLGADVAINYNDTAVDKIVAQYTDGQGFDFVFDTVGNNNLQNAFQAVKLNGTVVSTVSTS